MKYGNRNPIANHKVNRVTDGAVPFSTTIVKSDGNSLEMVLQSNLSRFIKGNSMKSAEDSAFVDMAVENWSKTEVHHLCRTTDH
jgi:hypothetical protein